MRVVKGFFVFAMYVALGVAAAPGPTSTAAVKPTPAVTNSPAPKQDTLIEIKSKAEAGDPAAQIAFGEQFARMGRYKAAERWYREAASQGSPAGLFALAELYSGSRGEGPNMVKADFTNAITLHKLAAAQGLSKSHLQLGIAYKDGNHVRKDLVRAYSHLKLADATSNRDMLLNQTLTEMTQAQIDEAENIAKRFKPANFDKAFADVVFESIHISGIFGGGTNWIAMIDGKQVGEGQQIKLMVGGINAQVKLAAIAPDGVFVSYGSLERKIKPQRL